MLTALIATFLSLVIPDAEADALRLTAPIPGNPGLYYLTVDSAREHIAAASAAALATGTDVDLLLSIAWHESRYKAEAMGLERGRMVSCGVMQPHPKPRCEEEDLVVFHGYLRGAQHLRRDWLDKTPSLHVALIGYAGGWAAIERCKSGPVWIRPGVDGCRTPEVFLHRARRIRQARLRASKSLS